MNTRVEHNWRDSYRAYAPAQPVVVVKSAVGVATSNKNVCPTSGELLGQVIIQSCHERNGFVVTHCESRIKLGLMGDKMFSRCGSPDGPLERGRLTLLKSLNHM